MKGNFIKGFAHQIITCLLAVAVLLLTIFSVISGNSDNIGRNPQNPPIYAASETFRTAAWGLPPNANIGEGKYANNPNYSTAENYITMSQCGFEYAMPTHDTTDEHIINTLQVAQIAGMKVLIRDLHVQGIQYANMAGGTYAEARERYNKLSTSLKARYDVFKMYDSFAGVIAYDEPDSTMFEAIAAGQDWFLTNYPEYEYYVNLFPNYASQDQLFGTDANKGYTYADHVKMFIEKVNPQLISYDHYALVQDEHKSKFIADNFLYNLYVFAKEAKEHDIPFYIYLQTMGFNNNVPLSNYAEFAWQAYTSMAFGVQGIQCFCYWTLLGDNNNITSACVDRDGTILDTYYWVQEVFSDIKSFEKVYMSFKWDGVKLFEATSASNNLFSYIKKANQLKKLKGVNKVTTTQDLIFGQFLDKENYPAFMVSNASSPFDLKNATISITFDKSVTVALVYQKGECKTMQLNGHKLNLELASGDGAFVIPL